MSPPGGPVREAQLSAFFRNRSASPPHSPQQIAQCLGRTCLPSEFKCFPSGDRLKRFPLAHPQRRLKTPTGSKKWPEHKELVHSDRISIGRADCILVFYRVALSLRLASRSSPLQSPEAEFRSLSSREEARMFLFGLSASEKPALTLGWNLIRMKPPGVQRVS